MIEQRASTKEIPYTLYLEHIKSYRANSNRNEKFLDFVQQMQSNKTTPQHEKSFFSRLREAVSLLFNRVSKSTVAHDPSCLLNDNTSSSLVCNSSSIEDALDTLLDDKILSKKTAVCIDYDGTLARKDVKIPAPKKLRDFYEKLKTCLKNNDKIEPILYSLTSGMTEKKIADALVIKHASDQFPKSYFTEEKVEQYDGLYVPTTDKEILSNKIALLKQKAGQVFVCTKGACNDDFRDKFINEIGLNPATECIGGIRGNKATALMNHLEKSGKTAESIVLVDNNEDFSNQFVSSDTEANISKKAFFIANSGDVSFEINDHYNLSRLFATYLEKGLAGEADKAVREKALECIGMPSAETTKQNLSALKVAIEGENQASAFMRNYAYPPVVKNVRFQVLKDAPREYGCKKGSENSAQCKDSIRFLLMESKRLLQHELPEATKNYFAHYRNYAEEKCNSTFQNQLQQGVTCKEWAKKQTMKEIFLRVISPSLVEIDLGFNELGAKIVQENKQLAQMRKDHKKKSDIQMLEKSIEGMQRLYNKKQAENLNRSGASQVLTTLINEADKKVVLDADTKKLWQDMVTDNEFISSVIRFTSNQ
ncbi:MAG: hypothetical protein HQK52_10405 [Oligoflexia bacterium]|nr:hypothetical protein [Oligoflexia bacterium]